MTGVVRELGGRQVYVCDAEGAPIGSPQSALDLLGEMYGSDAEWVVIPAPRFMDGFFRLRTRIAGEFIQKLVNYRQQLAIVGDIAAHVAASEALRDFVAESNRGRQVWFVEDLDELGRRLEGRTAV